VTAGRWKLVTAVASSDKLFGNIAESSLSVRSRRVSVAAFAAVRMPRQRSVTVFATVKSSSQLSKHVLTACCQKKKHVFIQAWYKNWLTVLCTQSQAPKGSDSSNSDVLFFVRI
jgi:hypothetical protein